MSATSPAIPPSPPSMADVLKHRRPLRNVDREVLEHLSALDRLALWITIHVGSMGFFLTIFGWTVCWLGWNVLAPRALQFDPPMAFVFWLFISNVIQILLMPLIMVGQNLQSRRPIPMSIWPMIMMRDAMPIPSVLASRDDAELVHECQRLAGRAAGDRRAVNISLCP